MADRFSKNLTLLSVLIAFSILLLVLDKLVFLNWLKGGVEKVINPAKLQINRLNQSLLLKRKIGTDPVILQAKIDYLQAENAQLQSQLQSLLEENQVFKEQLKVPKKKAVGFIPAKNLAVVDGLMTLSVGQNDGVVEGMVVVSQEALVGKVTGVTPFTSRLTLPLKEGNQIKVKILPTNEKGILKGTAEGRLILDEVLQKAKLSEEQVIVTTGEEGNYPADLPIGKIEKVIKDDVEIYQKAEIKPLVDYPTLKVVMIRI